MNNSAADRRSPLGLFPGQLAPRLALRHPQGLGGLAASGFVLSWPGAVLSM